MITSSTSAGVGCGVFGIPGLEQKQNILASKILGIVTQDGMPRLVKEENMRFLGSIAFAATLLMPLFTAHAAENQRTSVGELRRYCVEANKPSGQTRDAIATGYCFGSVGGFVYGVKIGAMAVAVQTKNEIAERSPLRFAETVIWCAPETADNKQFAAVFTQWAERNPARWHEAFPLGLVSAFVEAWPCKS